MKAGTESMISRKLGLPSWSFHFFRSIRGLGLANNWFLQGRGASFCDRINLSFFWGGEGVGVSIRTGPAGEAIVVFCVYLYMFVHVHSCLHIHVSYIVCIVLFVLCISASSRFVLCFFFIPTNWASYFWDLSAHNLFKTTWTLLSAGCHPLSPLPP